MPRITTVRAGATARLVRARRVVPLFRALETAAVGEDAAALWADIRRQRRAGTASIAANLAAKTALRCEEQVLGDMLFTMPPDTNYRLVHEGRLASARSSGAGSRTCCSAAAHHDGGGQP